MRKKITKAVFPVAGLGTRFLPATKASPKEMLSIVDKPLIQYAVEEAVAAGITEMIFVTGRNKRAIEDHFDKAYELEAELEARNKSELLNVIRSIKPDNVECFYVRQAEALGLGHAVLCAERLVNGEPFAVMLADDLLDGETPVMQQMTELYEQYGCSVIGVENIAREQSRSYGVISGTSYAERLIKLNGIVEKPASEKAPSTLGVVGRYVLTPAIFKHLRELQPGTGGEIQLTDGIASLLAQETVLAYQFEGIRYDCGSKLGYLQATVQFALRHPEVREEFRSFLQNLPFSQPRLPRQSAALPHVPAEPVALAS
ncbi:UTP--glucose-1-phosphate uridylyltransferase GalU [Noviherbaspirillum denitrificans]|uniref:UTP--glucose-1-phosphate uridylyltransferase n=1 Tax=Noviherbaspirillum denitrificans TaxID=1968433 RepID=A0A254TQS5_9BURK|nr:UTP--glucose-1-phosphate uridylyltransferase GalU [Noviherbaspirillum denitrificans]OWW22088.1 UTP--glucose-1-phosphate uridylyltransferase [Noviherbaspirillum denitrificans]